MSLSLITSLALFAIGVSGVLTRRDLPRILISVSIILASITLLLVTLTTASNIGNHSFVLFIWAVEVMEIVMALAIFIYLVRSGKTDINELKEMKW
jgi:NADH-quinone oxidoreductase subunit K